MRATIKTFCAFVVMAFASMAARAAEATGTLPTFTVTSVNRLDGPGPKVMAINRNGTRAGFVLSGDAPVLHADAFIQLSGGEIRLLPRLAGADNTYAFHLNDNDWVIGSYEGGGIIWPAQQDPIPFANPPGAQPLSTAEGINNENRVVGTVNGAGVVWEQGRGFRHLGGLPGGSAVSATDISGNGFIVGHSLGPFEHAFRRSPTGNMIDLGLLPTGSESAAFGVNERGHVAGLAATINGSRPFFWSEETGLVNLGTIPSSDRTTIARDINNHDWVVGDVYGATDTQFRAFIWTPATGLLDLNDLLDESVSGWRINRALQVTDEGTILGRGTKDGVIYTIVLNPVPEPAGWPLLLSVLGIFPLRRPGPLVARANAQMRL